MNLRFLQPKKSATKTVRNSKLVIRTQRCPQNHICPSVKVCPANALSQSGFMAPLADEEKCVKCGKCVRFCPMGVFLLK